MKKNFIYLGIILCVGLLEVACEKQEPVHYENNPGLYFYKRTIQGAPDFQDDSIAYSFFLQKSNVVRDTVWIDVRVMGFPVDFARPPRRFRPWGACACRFRR